MEIRGVKPKMDLTNLTINTTDLKVPKPYYPDNQCFEWALQQHVTIYNNLETWAVMIVVCCLILLLAYEFLNEHENLKKYSPSLIYFAKYVLYAFFFVYFVVIKSRLIHFLSGG